MISTKSYRGYKGMGRGIVIGLVGITTSYYSYQGLIDLIYLVASSFIAILQELTL